MNILSTFERMLKQFLLVLCMAPCAYAQYDRDLYRQAVEDMRQVNERVLNYHRKVNRDYLDFMKGKWKKTVPEYTSRSLSGDSLVILPEIYDHDSRPSRLYGVEYELVRPRGLSARMTEREKLTFDEKPTCEIANQEFCFNGFEISIRYAPECRIVLPDTCRANIDGVFEKMVSMPYGVLLNDIVKLAATLHLSDWSILCMIRDLADTLYGPASSGESVITQVFLLRSLGYRVALARDSAGRLYRLVSFDARVNGVREFHNDGVAYSLMESGADNELTVFYFNEMSEYPVCLMPDLNERFYPEYSGVMSYRSSSFSDISVSVPLNLTLKKFYGDYPSYYTDENPLTEFYYRAILPMSSEIEEYVYPALLSAVKGKERAEALDILLDFVQTAFDYGMDDRVWSKERYFFPGEIWYHKISDCDDRAILFSRLVRDILGLKTALVYWPGHLSCAVDVGSIEKGYKFSVGSNVYMSCDPTWPEARVGDMMHQFKNIKPSLILL